MSARSNLFALDQAGLRAFFVRLGETPFRATQLMKWVYHHGITDFAQMTNFSKALRAQLPGIAHFALPEIIAEQRSQDGTCKWLLRVDGQNCIETVFIPETGRGTLCISSQVGCALNCRFCATGRQGFSRNLSVAEIIGQVWLANERLGYFRQRQRIISNVVLMGMGEPLLNFDNVVTAIALMRDDFGFGLSARRITLSTAGLVPAMDKLSKASKVSLAVSLHAANDALRDVLVPLNRRYSLKALLAACRRYAEAQGGAAITFEYTMLAGVNDSLEDARRLAELLRPLPAKINLIPFNPFPDSGYTRPSQSAIDQFRETLLNAGLMTMTRKTRGDDIDAACGQLVGEVAPRAKRLERRG